jgi:biopolymer transport protein ExbD
MSFGEFDESFRAPMSEINTTPLVDVMLVLLIIFIVTAPLLTHSIPIELPKAGSKVTPEKPDAVTLSINAGGALFWNDAPISDADLPARMAEAGAKNPQPELRLRADLNTRYQRITEIMAAAKEAGIQKLGFISQPQPQSR